MLGSFGLKFAVFRMVCNSCLSILNYLMVFLDLSAPTSMIDNSNIGNVFRFIFGMIVVKELKYDELLKHFTVVTSF